MQSAMLMLARNSSAALPLTEITGGGSESYRPLLELGRGGMARVYLAERTGRGLRKLVVLKVLDPTLAGDQEMRTAFRREAELCARLNHPNIVQVFEVLDEIAAPMMVMEYVEGVSLSQILTRSEGRLPVRQHVHIIMQVLAGLHYFHELKDSSGNSQHAVHRDVSPQNVLVMHEGAVKVLDFGIAKVRDATSAEITQAGTIKGKLSYMPGEQVAGDATIDRRADIFAAGVMLWEAFARRRMWHGWQQPDVVKALVAHQIPSITEACPWISPGWAAIITRATAGRREERFATALEMHIAIEECMAELGGPVPQRELASFMIAEFGEWRVERQKLVDAELAKPAIPLATVLGGTVSHTAQLLQLTQTSALSSADSRWLERSRKVSWLVVALLLVCAGAAAMTQLVSSARPVRAADTAPRRIRVSIAATPPEAHIAIDGNAVARNPWTDVIAASPGTKTVEVTAPGYRSTTRQLSLTDDVSLSIQLEPLPAPLPEPMPVPSTSSSSKPARAKTRPAAHVASPQPSSSAGAAVANCNPPYSLDAEGVKTYKPECL